jgi:predicted DCC family thiol-disulfide oxidoreductase YuxK
MEELMDRIHGRLPTGQLIEGVEVFRQLYSAIGLGWIVALTRLPGLRWLLDVAYRFFARNRLKWTGRCTPETGCVIGRDVRESTTEPTPTQKSTAPLEHVR